MLGFAMSVGFQSSTSPLIAAPSISAGAGGGYAGTVYTALPGVWSNATPSGAWYADNNAIPGAMASTFTMTMEFEGAAITWRETVDGRVAVSNSIEMWVPQDAAGLVALMDIRAGVTRSGAVVSAWASRTGGLSATNVQEAQQPTFGATAFNGSPGMVLDGVDDNLSGLAVSAAPASRSYIGAVRFNNVQQASTYATLLRAPVEISGGYGIRRGPGGQIEVFASAVGIRASGSSVYGANAAAILSSRITGAGAFSFRRNGIPDGSGTSAGGFTGNGTASMGAMPDGSQALNGCISSQLIYDTFLPDIDVARCESWTAWTLGKPSLLDTGHPYKHIPAQW